MLPSKAINCQNTLRKLSRDFETSEIIRFDYIKSSGLALVDWVAHTRTRDLYLADEY